MLPMLPAKPFMILSIHKPQLEMNISNYYNNFLLFYNKQFPTMSQVIVPYYKLLESIINKLNNSIYKLKEKNKESNF